MEKQEIDINSLYDLIVVGGGPAGLSAAIYMARARYKVLVIEKNQESAGQISITSEVVNYPGILRASGKEIMKDLNEQAQAFGAELLHAEVMDMELQKDVKTIYTTKGEFKCLGVILAVGANPRKLGFIGEKEFQGRGVAYCATCDGEFFTGMEVFVIGGGFAAVEEGMFLTKYATKVHMIVREPDFTCAKTITDQLKNYDKIDVRFNTELLEVKGEGVLTSARFKDNVTGQVDEVSIPEGFGVFVFAGYVPNTQWIPKAVNRDLQGYIITNATQKTNLNGVYAAGDVCIKQLRQVVTAVSDGAIAATSLEKDLSKMHELMNIPQLEIKHREKPKPEKRKVNDSADDDDAAGFLNSQIRQQLKPIMEKLNKDIVLKLRMDDRPISGELKGFVSEFAQLSDRLSIVEESVEDKGQLPELEIAVKDGDNTGIKFHGVPGGHEINSFVLAIYNIGGPGKELEPELLDRIAGISEPVNIKILVSLSCTMCPESVMSAQRIAALSPMVTAEMYDLMHFPNLKDRYKVMSVPCMVIDDNEKNVHFGKKGISEILDII